MLSRNSSVAATTLPATVKIIENLNQLGGKPIDILVNLTGEPIADKRWSKKRKLQIVESRINTTQGLYDFFKSQGRAPQTVISGSAIGYYGGGTANNQKVTENGAIEQNFSHNLCSAWEQTAQQFEALGSRVCLLRTGIVLGPQGALKKLLPVFKFGLGGPIASGQQWMSWVHLDDMVDIIIYCIQHVNLRGAVNATAPKPVTNREFAKILGGVLNRPAIAPMPAAIVKLIFGQMGKELMLDGQRVIPDKLHQQGFKFKYSELQAALIQILT